MSLPSSAPLARNRIAHLDVARGIGIILVVLGHNRFVNGEAGLLFRVIYSFHMPLFFLLAGVLFKADAPLETLIRNRSDALLKPYAATLAVWALWWVLFQGNSLLGYVARVSYASGPSVPVVGLWFLPHLWLLTLFAWTLLRLLPARARVDVLARAGVLLLLLAVGMACLGSFWATPVQLFGRPLVVSNRPLQWAGLPFSADLLLLTTFWFLLGHWLRGKLFTVNFGWLWLAASAALLLCSHWMFDNTIGLNGRYYGDPLVSNVMALAGITMVLAASNLIARVPAMARALAYVGSGSLFVLMFHGAFQAAATDLLIAVTRLPAPAVATLGLVVGCAMPLLLWELAKRSKVLSALWLPLRPDRRALRARLCLWSSSRQPRAACTEAPIGGPRRWSLELPLLP